MQLFKPIPKRKADCRLRQRTAIPVNSVSTSQVAEDSVSLLLRWGMRRDVPVDDVSPRLEPV
ncbi:hypothetical protein GQ600_24900 [Phytophthora cactorum]|nr:hypothetical protein GQ600_24900 [Phytophthora cactorum]